MLIAVWIVPRTAVAVAGECGAEQGESGDVVQSGDDLDVG
jgi:hypothetical protein